MKAIAAAALVAVLIQPLVLAGQLVGVKLLGLVPLSEGNWQDLLSAAGGISAYVLVVASVFVCLAGVPVFLILRRLDTLGWRSLSGAGFVVAAVPAAAMTFPPGVVLLFGIQGLVGAAAFYAVWHRIAR